MTNDDAITPRDLFAAAALAGIMAGSQNQDDEDSPPVWQWAFQLADAMMAQRQRPPCRLDEDGWIHESEVGGE